MARRGILITFTVRSKKFKSNYERNKFFRALYGWKQMLRKGDKKYTYEREGLLDRIPHKKVDQSSFIVKTDDFDEIENFFDEWAGKVMSNTFKVLLERDMFKELEAMRARMEKEMREEMEEFERM